MQITVCGHAAVLLEAGTTRILVDPVFEDSYASGAIGFHPAREVDVDAIGRLDAIIITHHHLDHWNAPTVMRFDRATTILVPPDDWLIGRLGELGFTDVHAVAPWTRVLLGPVPGNNGSVSGIELLITPSTADINELGFVAVSGAASYWHMSDTLVDRAVGRKVRDEVGPISVVAARYLPGESLIAYQRGLGSGRDERDLMIELLEAACVTNPALAFPYFGGFAFLDEHAWANRWAKPYAPAEVVELLRRRLGDDARAAELLPGDVVEIGGTDGRMVRVGRGMSPFVRSCPGEVDGWEPVDASTLAGPASDADRDELRSRLEDWFRSTFGPWLQDELRDTSSPQRALFEWGVVWECVVHLGDGRRLCYQIDFRAEPIRFSDRSLGPANYGVHLSGKALLAVLRGEAGAELFWMAGASRTFEKVIGVKDGQIVAPATRGWDLFEACPEPVTHCLRRVGVRDANLGGGMDAVTPAVQ